MSPRILIAKEDRRDMLLNASIRSLVPRMAIPTIISMLITTFYGLVDTYFISYLGTSVRKT